MSRKTRSTVLPVLLAFIAVFSFSAIAEASGWIFQQSGTTCNLNSVDFVDDLTGFAVGDRATVLATGDGGATWKSIGPVSFATPDFVSANTWAIHWQSVQFLDEKIGWIAGTLVFTYEPDDGSASETREIGIVCKTEDAGQSWRLLYPVCDNATDCAPDSFPLKKISEIFVLNERVAWAVGDYGRYIATADGGATWKHGAVGISAIPEIIVSNTCTFWSSQNHGWIAGRAYDMNDPSQAFGYIVRTEDGGGTWEREDDLSNTVTPPLHDLEFVMAPTASSEEIARLAGWAVGESGCILNRLEDVWKPQYFPWPFSLPLPVFRAAGFVDGNHGWLAGYHGKILSAGQDDTVITIFHTTDGGKRWYLESLIASDNTGELFCLQNGKLNDIDAARTGDAWAVGDDGVILYRENTPPEICSASAEPHLVYAGGRVQFNAEVKDIDGIGDIDSVNVDMASIGGGKVELSPDRTVSDDRRCVPYSAIARIPLAAPYGSTILPVKALDVAGASDADAVELFIVTSYVEIFRTWAEPETVVSMEKVLLSAEVGIVAPKDGDTPETGEMPENKVERVTVDITELLGVDCEPDADCIVIVDMKDEDGDGVYEYPVESATGPYGTHLLPVVAYDTLGHVDKDVLKVAIRPETLEKGDLNGDGVVDLKDSLLAFNIAAGLVPSDWVYVEADVDGDQNLGIVEALYSLRYGVNKGMED